MSHKLDVSFNGAFSYHIYIERDFSRLAKTVAALGTEGRRALIVTDDNVAPLYLDIVKDELSRCFGTLDSLILKAGSSTRIPTALQRFMSGPFRTILTGMTF